MKNLKITLFILTSLTTLSSCLKDDAIVPLTSITLVTTPVNGAINVKYDTTVIVKATFNVDVNAATVNASTFVIKSSQGAILVGTTNYANKVATFSSNNFQPSTKYTAVITTGIASSVGKLSANFEWSFTTADVPVIPIINSFQPLQGFDGDTLTVVGDNFKNPVFSMNGKIAQIVNYDSKNAVIIIPTGASTSVLNVKVGSNNSKSTKTFEIIDPKTEIALITKTLLGTWNNVYTSIQSYKGKVPYSIDLLKGFDTNSDKFFDSLLYSKQSLNSLEFLMLSDTLICSKTSTYITYNSEKDQQYYYVSIVLSKKRSVGTNALTPHAFQIIEKTFGNEVSTIYDSYDLTNGNMTALLSKILIEKNNQSKLYRVKFKKS